MVKNKEFFAKHRIHPIQLCIKKLGTRREKGLEKQTSKLNASNFGHVCSVELRAFDLHHKSRKRYNSRSYLENLTFQIFTLLRGREHQNGPEFSFLSEHTYTYRRLQSCQNLLSSLSFSKRGRGYSPCYPYKM